MIAGPGLKQMRALGGLLLQLLPRCFQGTVLAFGSLDGVGGLADRLQQRPGHVGELRGVGRDGAPEVVLRGSRDRGAVAALCFVTHGDDVGGWG